MANALRGEVALVLGERSFRLRPSFARLVAAEAETGSLLVLLERASAGEARLGDMAALFWHCLEAERLDRVDFEATLLAAGVSVGLAPYRALLLSIFRGD